MHAGYSMETESGKNATAIDCRNSSALFSLWSGRTVSMPSSYRTLEDNVRVFLHFSS